MLSDNIQYISYLNSETSIEMNVKHEVKLALPCGSSEVSAGAIYPQDYLQWQEWLSHKWKIHNVQPNRLNLSTVLILLLLLSVGLPVANAPDVLQPCGLLYHP